VNGTLVSAIVTSFNVLAPVNVCVVPRSATVMLPVGRVAFVAPAVVRVNAPVPATSKFCARARVPVVHVGEPVLPDTSA